MCPKRTTGMIIQARLGRAKYVVEFCEAGCKRERRVDFTFYNHVRRISAAVCFCGL